MNASLVWAAKVANAAIGFVTSVVIARLLGPDGRAEYFLAATVAAGVFALSHLSLDQAIFWGVTERRASVRGIVRTISPLTAVLAIGSLGVYWVIDHLGLLGNLPADTVLAGAVLAPVLLVRFIVDAVLYTTGRSLLASVSLVATALIQLVGIAVLAMAGEVTSTTVLAVSGVSTLVGGLGNALAVARQKDGLGRTVDARSLIDLGLRNHLAVVALWLALRADVVIVAQYVDKRELGLYSLAVTLAETMLLATDALALTALGRHRELSREESLSYAVAVASQSARVAFVEVVAVVALGWPLILIAYGRDWLGAYPVLICLAPGIVALGYMRPLGAGFIRAGRALERSLVMTAAAVVNVAGALILAPRVGIIGAALTSSLAYGVGAVALAARVKPSLGRSPWVRGASGSPARGIIKARSSRNVNL